jgi:hypothetical protein
MMDNSEYRKGKIMALFANAMNSVEAEFDKVGGIGVDGEVWADLQADLTRLVDPWLRGGLSPVASAAYQEHYDLTLVDDES